MSDLLNHLALLTRLSGAPMSTEAISAQTLRQPNGRLDLTALSEVLQNHGLENTLSRRELDDIPPLAVPLLILLHDEQAAVVTRIVGPRDARVYTVEHPDGHRTEVSAAEVQSRYLGFCWFMKPYPRTDRRSELPEYTLAQGWLWKVLWRFKSLYTQVVVTTVMVNVLALVSSLYVMNVYDRVIPNKAFETLWALSLGVTAAIVFENLGRIIRAHLTDIAGKKADLIISAALFRRVMSLHLVQKPSSSGSYANNLREFESVRDVMTSATLLALVDLPFVFLFLTVIMIVAGPLAWVPFLSIPIVVAAGLFSQGYLSRYTNESMREGSQRQGLAVESIEGLETLKSLNATGWAQQRWEYYSAKVTASGQKLKAVSTNLVQFSLLVQQLNTVAIVVWGAYLVNDPVPAARITVGALMASVILCGRAIAPLSQVAMLMTRFNQARVAISGIDSIIERPLDRDPGRVYVMPQKFRGEISVSNAAFSYPATSSPTLSQINLELKPGERVAILGRIGSGKSTLLRVLAGMYEPAQGTIGLDGIELRQIDPADLRANVALLGAAPRLFNGTLRDNFDLATIDERVPDEAIMRALQRFGLDAFVRSHPKGLDMPVGDDGHGLSSGQKQLVGLARLTLRNPRVVLLDEPTSGLDEGTETRVLKSLMEWAGTRSLVIVTHRPQVFAIVNRIVVLDAGRIMLDAPKDAALQILAKGIVVPPRQSANIDNAVAAPALATPVQS
jgi:ATP-binding cassette subfamily C protein LapB